MENPQRNQQHEDIDGQPFSWNDTSFLWQLKQQQQEQQDLLEHWSDASDVSRASDLSGATDWSDAMVDDQDLGFQFNNSWTSLAGRRTTQEVGNESEGTGEGEEGQLNSRCLRKGKSKVRTPRGESGNKETRGVRIRIPLEDILQKSGMRLKDAAKNLNVSASTLKRVCRGYNIYRWPPHVLPSNQTLASVDTDSVIVKAKYADYTIRFKLSEPWEKAKLEEQVKVRLKLEARTYLISYKDEEGDLVLITCDEDLQLCISSSRQQGNTSVKVFLSERSS